MLPDISTDYEDGYNNGFHDGHIDGYERGWEEAANEYEQRIGKLSAEIMTLEARINVLAQRLS